jgi:hypothetical protein
MKARSIPQAHLSGKCWTVQMEGLAACKTGEEAGQLRSGWSGWKRPRRAPSSSQISPAGLPSGTRARSGSSTPTI